MQYYLLPMALPPYLHRSRWQCHMPADHISFHFSFALFSLTAMASSSRASLLERLRISAGAVRQFARCWFYWDIRAVLTISTPNAATILINRETELNVLHIRDVAHAFRKYNGCIDMGMTCAICFIPWLTLCLVISLVTISIQVARRQIPLDVMQMLLPL